MVGVSVGGCGWLGVLVGVGVGVLVWVGAGTGVLVGVADGVRVGADPVAVGV